MNDRTLLITIDCDRCPAAAAVERLDVGVYAVAVCSDTSRHQPIWTLFDGARKTDPATAVHGALAALDQHRQHRHEGGTA